MGSCCRKTADKIVHGSAGIAKALAHIDRPPPNVIEARRMLCRACSEAVACPTAPKRKCFCAACDCILRAKTAVGSESCPRHKWAAYTTPTTDTVMSAAPTQKDPTP